MNINSRTLSKSRYKLSLECPTKLYYTGKDEYANKKSQDQFLMALAEGGFQVGELAKYYYPGGHDIKTINFQQALHETNKLLKQENVIIYEPAIQYNNFVIRVDILVKKGNKIDLIEVKAKSFTSKDDFFAKRGGYIDKSWRPYLYDVAFQTMVAQKANPNWNITPYLMLADKNKKTSVDGLNQLFIVEKNKNGYKSVKTNNNITPNLLCDKILTAIEVSDIVQQIWEGRDIDPKKKTIEDEKEFLSRAEEYATYYNQNKKFPVSLGLKCKNCEFKNDNQPMLKNGFDECWKSKYPNFDIEEDHIFGIWNFRKSPELINKGVIYQKDLYSDSDLIKSLNPRQFLQVEKTVTKNIEEDIKPELFEEMDKWTFPLHFIDFETSMMAIPFLKNRKPYEQIAFQFSCHTLYENGEIKHSEWISKNRGEFPNYKFVNALKGVLDKDEGTIFKYSPHENTVLRQIQSQMESEPNSDDYKELINWIDEISEWKDEANESREGIRNMVDLLKLVKQYYYHPLMKGSNSIKAVLPSIFSSSEFIKNKYSKPVGFGENLKDLILWQENQNSGFPFDPYKLLPNKYEEFDLSKDELFLEDGEIQEGGSAMMAFGKMQFTEMTDTERNAIVSALLQYCELDTLAMVMIYEHWKSLK